jgi:transcriptional regulator with XRE-family HTH domain
MKTIHGTRSGSVRQSPSLSTHEASGVTRGVCGLCGLDRTYVGGIERGERNVSLVNLEKPAKALKISLSELFRSV